MTDTHQLTARLAAAAEQTGGSAGVTVDGAESRALLDLIEAAEAAARAIAPVVAGDRRARRRWWVVLPEIERAQLELRRALTAVAADRERGI